MGAPDPRTQTNSAPAKKSPGINLVKGRKFWAFQPVPEVAPRVKNRQWVQTPVGQFVLAGLEAVSCRSNWQAICCPRNRNPKRAGTNS